VKRGLCEGCFSDFFLLHVLSRVQTAAVKSSLSPLMVSLTQSPAPRRLSQRALLAALLSISLTRCSEDAAHESTRDAGSHPGVTPRDAAASDDARDGGGFASDASSPLETSDAQVAGDDGGTGPEPAPECAPGSSGNPFVEGWYADPDMKLYGEQYWVYPTYSAPYDDQTYLDAFSSPDLVHWTKHARVLDTEGVSWAKRAIWAPSPIYRDGTYYLYFGANDIQSDAELGGIGVATAETPEGPYRDALGSPLIGHYENGAQPIDQNVFLDDDGQAYLYYGGHGHCNVVKLNSDMKSLGQFGDGSTFKEITPSGYVEGALMFKRSGTYYLMWSEGGWTGPDYRVSYAMADSPIGPFDKLGTILSQNASIATGSGHNTVVQVPGKDEWYIFYHRHPLGEADGNHRVLAFDKLVFRPDGTIKPVEMLVQDNFCDDNAYGFESYDGTWTVHDGQYEVSAGLEGKSVLNTNFSLLQFEADVSVSSTGDAGLLFRARDLASGADAYRGYYAGIDAEHGRVILGKANLGTWTELASATRTIEANTRHHLEVVAKQDTLQVYLDEEEAPVLTASDSEHSEGTTGFRARATTAQFDHLHVSTPKLVIFYADGNFGGLGVALEPGSYTLAQLTAAGIPNEWMSSLRVPEGFTVKVYAEDNFTGAEWTFLEDAPLVPDAANDQMSSVEIIAP
jgi:hypothetical protein